MILFFFGLYYMAMEFYQMVKLGIKAYFDSMWNFMDLASYSATLVITPCYLFRIGLGDGAFVPALVSARALDG